MAKWTGVITNAGNTLLNSLVGEKTLHLQSVEAGSGTVETAALMAQTALAEIKQTARILAAEEVEGGVRLKIRITDPPAGYTLNQIGVVAYVDEKKPILLALYQNDAGVEIPAKEESPDFVFTFYAMVMISNTCTWTVNIDASALVTSEEMQAAIASVMDEALLKGGGTMEGPIAMGGNRVTGLGAPVELEDAATKAYADGKTQFFSVTLSAQGWAEQRQSVAAPGVTAGNSTHVFAAPAAESGEGYAAYLDCGVYCAEKGSGTLTFVCDSVPDMDLTVHVALFADGGSFVPSPGETEQLPDAEQEAF